MSKLVIAVIALAGAARVAAADPHHVLVLHSGGSADASARTHVDAEVLALAKHLEGNIEAGDITYADAAAAVGCDPTDPGCKDQVLGTMGVDELVLTTVDATGGGLSVTVQLVTKSGAPRQASAMVPAGAAADSKLTAQIGPLFGVAAPAEPAQSKPGEPAVSATTSKPAEPAATSKPTEPEPAQPATSPPATPPAPATSATVTAAPENQIVASPEDRHAQRMHVIGMAAGGGLVALGIFFWAEASSNQSAIDNAPTPRTPQDFKYLQDLESTGDTDATIGNIAFVGGLAVAAAYGYLFWRDHRHHAAQQAQLAPAVFDHGAGIALTFGGVP